MKIETCNMKGPPRVVLSFNSLGLGSIPLPQVLRSKTETS